MLLDARLGFVLGSLLLLAACGQEAQPSPTSGAASPSPTSGVVDMRFDPPPVPEGGAQYLTPDYEVPPYSERQYCYYFTYDGPNVGIDLAEEYQDPSFGHHVILLKANVLESDYPDGSWYDCSTLDNMVDMEPIYIAPDNPEAGLHRMVLPSDTEAGRMAVSLKSGSRMVIQSHYVNYSANTIIVRDAINFHFVDPESVDTWVSSWSHTDIDLELPANTESTLTVRCTWDTDFTLLNMFGHMHELGMSISIDHIRAGSDAAERVYEVDDWQPEMRDDFPVQPFAIGEYEVKAGDTFVTTCTWFNDGDEPVVFPQEMCVSAGLLFPSKVAMICVPD